MARLDAELETAQGERDAERLRAEAAEAHEAALLVQVDGLEADVLDLVAEREKLEAGPGLWAARGASSRGGAWWSYKEGSYKEGSTHCHSHCHLVKLRHLMHGGEYGPVIG